MAALGQKYITNILYVCKSIFQVINMKFFTAPVWFPASDLLGRPLLHKAVAMSGDPGPPPVFLPTVTLTLWRVIRVPLEDLLCHDSRGATGCLISRGLSCNMDKINYLLFWIHLQFPQYHSLRKRKSWFILMITKISISLVFCLFVGPLASCHFHY